MKKRKTKESVKKMTICEKCVKPLGEGNCYLCNSMRIIRHNGGSVINA